MIQLWKEKVWKPNRIIFLKSLFQSVVICKRMNSDLYTVKTQHPLYTHLILNSITWSIFHISICWFLVIDSPFLWVQVSFPVGNIWVQKQLAADLMSGHPLVKGFFSLSFLVINLTFIWVRNECCFPWIIAKTTHLKVKFIPWCSKTFCPAKGINDLQSTIIKRKGK